MYIQSRKTEVVHFLNSDSGAASCYHFPLFLPNCLSLQGLKFMRFLPVVVVGEGKWITLYKKKPKLFLCCKRKACDVSFREHRIGLYALIGPTSSFINWIDFRKVKLDLCSITIRWPVLSDFSFRPGQLNYVYHLEDFANPIRFFLM